ncbi:hypothetical protein OROHE_008128 [Orobanche hederae]
MQIKSEGQFFSSAFDECLFTSSTDFPPPLFQLLPK